MFYNRGKVLSDQFDHFRLILFWVPECSFGGRAGGVGPRLGKNSHIFPGFFWQTSLIDLSIQILLCGRPTKEHDANAIN